MPFHIQRPGSRRGLRTGPQFPKSRSSYDRAAPPDSPREGYGHRDKRRQTSTLRHVEHLQGRLRFLRGLDAAWHLFDEIFASGCAGMRKPEAIFVYDKGGNVKAAREAGLHAVQFKSATETGAELRRLLDLQSR